jgi:hypothetical protein
MYAVALATFLCSVVATVLIGVYGRSWDRRFELITVAISGLFVSSILFPRHGGQNVGLTFLFPSIESLLILVACSILVTDRARGGLRYFAILTGYYILTFAGAYHQFADDHGKAPFVVQGVHATLGRLDSIYFALVTSLPTGVGEISPNTSTARGIVSMQIVTGFVLFGCLLVRALNSSGKSDS